MNYLAKLITQSIKASTKSFKEVLDFYRAKQQKTSNDTFIAHMQKKCTSLTKEEKREVIAQWKYLTKVPMRWGFDYLSAYKALNGFDIRVLPTIYYFSGIHDILNPEPHRTLLSHKAISELIMDNEVRHPETILRSFGGVLLDSHYTSVSPEQGLKILEADGNDCLVKLATDSMQGLGVFKLDHGVLEQLSTQILTGRYDTYKSDFVVQKIATQSPLTSIFNPTSINCFRITTININGYVSAPTIIFKAGAFGSFVDNMGTGKRGVVVGVNADGKFRNIGMYGNGELANSHNGISFDGYEVPQVKCLIDAAVALHSKINSVHIIGFDLALDQNNKPLLIEANTVYPGVTSEQLMGGPIFGDRTMEVVQFLRDSIRK